MSCPKKPKIENEIRSCTYGCPIGAYACARIKNKPFYSFCATCWFFMNNEPDDDIFTIGDEFEWYCDAGFWVAVPSVTIISRWLQQTKMPS